MRILRVVVLRREMVGLQRVSSGRLSSPHFLCRDAGVGKSAQNMRRSVVFIRSSLAVVSPWLCAVDEPRLQQYCWARSITYQFPNYIPQHRRRLPARYCVILRSYPQLFSSASGGWKKTPSSTASQVIARFQRLKP